MLEIRESTDVSIMQENGDGNLKNFVKRKKWEGV